MLSARQIINWGFGSALVLSLLTGAASWTTLRRVREAGAWVQRTQELRFAIRRLVDPLSQAEGGIRGYAVTRQAVYLEPLARAEALVPVRLRELRRIAAGVPDDSASVDSLARLVDLRMAALEVTRSALSVRRVVPAEVTRRIEEGREASASVLRIIRDLEAAEHTRLQERAARAARLATLAESIVLAASLLAAAVVALALVFINRNAAERARAAAALREAQERSRVILDTVVEGIIAIDERGLIEGLNPAAERLFGWPAGEAVGRDIGELMPESYAAEHGGHLARYLETGEARAIGRTREVLGKRRDGTTFTLELALGEVVLEHRRLFTGIIRDVTERKRMEATLRETMELQRAILDSANNSIISTDPDGVIRTFNATAERWLGYRADEMVGRTTPAVIHDREEMARRAAELTVAFGAPVAPGFDVLVEEARRGLPSQREWTYIRRDGSRFPVLLSVAALRDPDGAVAGFLGIASDLTERRAAEQAREDTEAQFRSVVDVLGEGIYVQEVSGRIVEANQSAARILGLAREELVGRDANDAPWQTLREDGTPMLPDERPASVALRTAQPVRNTVVGALRPDGRLVWLLVNVQPMAFARDGRPTAAVSSFSDISRRKEAEQAVRENQARLQDFLDNAHDLIVSTGPEGRLQYVNRAWEEALGIRAVDALGRSIFSFLDPACHAGYRAAFATVLTGDTVSDLEAVFLASDGRPVTVFGSSNCRFEDGRATAIRSVFRDVTEIKRTQEALEWARDEAERANRAKSVFLANMSHELRTPLNSVIGFAGVLLKNRSGNLRESDLTYLGRIQENGKHLLDLINSVLDLSKIEAGRFELELGPVDLGQVVREALALAGAPARPEVVLAVELPAKLRTLTGDAAKLKQVVVNLVANALKFTERGRVTVRVVADASGEPDRLEVEDTGIGIPADRQAAIFEAFHQADGSTARRFGGTGLGLTISRSLVEMMGFRLELVSVEGRGSTFRVAFRGQPAAAPAAEGARAAAAPAATNDELRGKLVLIIDNDPDARTLLGQLIGELGPRTIAAGSGAEGLRMARRERPDLVTVDLLMPGMTGWEVVRAMRADPDLRAIPAVVVSIVASERGATVAGAAGLVDKPVDRDQLLAALRRNLLGAGGRMLP